MGFKTNNEAKGEAKILDVKARCSLFCKQFKELGERDPQECEELLYSYFAKLKQKHKDGNLDAGTIKNRKSTVKNLLKKTKVQVDWDEVFKGLPKPRRYTNDRAYSLDEIRKICEYSDKRIKPIVYTMASSGMRLGAWDYLKWSHITPLFRDGEVICALIEPYYGTDKQYPTLITKEAYMELTKWMEFRRKSGEEINGDSWVMRHYWDTKEGFTHGSIGKPEQLKSNGVKSLLDSALRRQGLRKNLSGGKTRHEVKLNHGFRKHHETQLIKAALKQVDVNILQGHANDGMVDHYYRPSMNPDNRIDDYLINEFLKAEQFLIIDEKQKEIDEIRKDLDKKYEDVKKEVELDIIKRIEENKKKMEQEWLNVLKAAGIRI
jgi:integrase